MNKFVVGLSSCEAREYVIGGVKYIVDAKFEKQGASLNQRLTRCIESDIVHLPIEKKQDMLEAENVCSAAGEED